METSKDKSAAEKFLTDQGYKAGTEDFQFRVRLMEEYHLSRLRELGEEKKAKAAEAFQQIMKNCEDDPREYLRSNGVDVAEVITHGLVFVRAMTEAIELKRLMSLAVPILKKYQNDDPYEDEIIQQIEALLLPSPPKEENV